MPATEDLAQKIDTAFPSPHPKTGAKDERPGVLSDADKDAMEKLLAELRTGGRESYLALLGMLVENDPAKDSKVRHALGALAIQSGSWKDDERRALADAMIFALGGDRPKEVQSFIIRQVQVCGTKHVAPVLGKLLADEALVAAAAAALLAIGEGAAEQFASALSSPSPAIRLACVQALGARGDSAYADPLRKSAQDPDADIRRTALWALANLGDAASTEPLLKAADDAEGFDRIALTKACLLLAERLTTAGNRAAAAKIYTHLRDTRTDKSEAYVRDVAERALAPRP
jgi:HEAT repeat protein